MHRTNLLRGIFLAIGLLLLAGTAQADTLIGYPCDIAMSSGDQLTVSLYTQAYCSGSSVGTFQVSSTNSASNVGAGVYLRDTLMRIYEKMIESYWRTFAISRDSSNRVFSISIRPN